MSAVLSLPEDVLFDHERSRVTALSELVKILRSFPRDADRAQFSRLFDNARSVLELDDIELARAFRVSRPTIGRWARGDSAPHALGREPVFQLLAEISEAKLKHHPTHRKHAVVR